MHLAMKNPHSAKKRQRASRLEIFQSRRDSRHGFALVATLMLMILLAIIAMGSLSLSAITLRTVWEEEAMAKARANARMALMLAVGELQKELGPDQRVNAPADQHQDPPAAVGRKQWMGVYDAWNSFEDTARPTSTTARWLVSGNPSADAHLSGPSSEDVVLYTPPDDSPDGFVSVPLVKIKPKDSNSLNGGYAWWIGDENAKALVKQAPKPSTTGDVWSRHQSAPNTGFILNEEFAAPLAQDPTDEKLARLVSLRTLDLVTGDAVTSQRTFHDFTTQSLGVLADVQRGGLKRDLSLFLDVPVSQPITPAMRPTGALYADGITYEELWLYHNLWRGLEAPINSSNFYSPTGGNLSGSQMLITAPGSGSASLSAFRSDPFTIYKHLTQIRLQWIVSIKSEPVSPPTTPATYQLYWVVDGIMTLWNPYDVPIAVHPDGLYSCRFWSLPYTFQVFNNSTRIAYGLFGDTAGGLGGVAPLTLMLGTSNTPFWQTRGTPDPVVLMPGEVMLMSEGPDSNVVYNSGSTTTIRAKAGWNLGQGKTSPAMHFGTHPIIPANANLSFQIGANSRGPNNSMTGPLVSFVNYYGPDDRGGSPSSAFQQFLGGKSVIIPTGERASDLTTQFEGVFAGVPRTTLPSPAVISGTPGKYPFMLFTHQVKTEDSPSSWTRFHNPKASWADFKRVGQAGQRERAMSSHEMKMTRLSGPIDSNMTQLSLNNIDRGLFGGSYTDHQRGQDIVITHSVPREPPLSLGAFQHAIANGNDGLRNGTNISDRLSTGNALSPYGSICAPEISKAIGNSYALPIFAPDQTSATTQEPTSPTATESKLWQDHSWHVNRTLWDSWFLSSIVQQQSAHHPSKRTTSEVFTDFAESKGLSPLPNTNMKPWLKEPYEAIHELFGDSGTKTNDAHEKAAGLLMVEGAFNVQSTSLPAWKAILSSMNKAVVPVAASPDAPGNTNLQNSTGVLASGLFSSHAPEFDDAILGNAGDSRQWRGFRSLTSSEIDALAEAIVKQVKLRGPFLSMADFVNRRVDPDKALALCGPLQAALDETINTTLLAAAGRKSTITAGTNYEFPEAAQGAKTLMGPAIVMQADLLTALGPQLTVRSDTFRIRAYGETRDPGGTRVIAQAWCEAIVQRVPDYMDPSDPPEAILETVVDRSTPVVQSEINKIFGRKLNVTSFRWLNPAEIES